MAHLDTLHRALACFGDPARRDSYFDLYSPDIILHGYEGVEPGLSSVKGFYALIWSAFPDATVQVEDVFETGDKLACRFVLTGTHQGNFNGIPPTGKAIRLPGITILRFSGERCVERWSQADFLGLLKQLGVA